MLVTEEDFAEWRQLADPSTPARVMMRAALTGNPEQVAALCENPALPIDVMLAIVNRPDEYSAGLLLARDVPPEIVVAAVEAHPEAAEHAWAHWCAPLAVKFSLPLSELVGASLMAFYTAVYATEEERAAVDALVVGGDTDRTLGDVWAGIRPGAP